MTLRLLTEKDDQALDELAHQHWGGLIYHCSTWKSMHELAFGMRPYYIGQFRDGVLCGVLPLFRTGLLGGNRLVGIPLGHLCGPLFESEADVASLMGKAQEVASQTRAKGIKLKAGVEMPLGGGFERLYRYSMAIAELAGPDDFWKAIKNKPTGRGVKKARKMGVEIVKAHSEEHWTAFYQLYVETRRSQGSPPYPYALFDTMRRLLEPAGHIELSLAVRSGEYLAGMIVLKHKDRRFYSFGASSKAPEALAARPNNLLFWTAMSEAADEGMTYFHFGPTPLDNPGLQRFKESWGGVTAPHYEYVSPPGGRQAGALGKKARYLVTNGLQRLPIPLFAKTSAVFKFW